MAGAATIWLVGFGLLPFLLPAATVAAGPVRIGASELVYSDLAQQIASGPLPTINSQSPSGISASPAANGFAAHGAQPTWLSAAESQEPKDTVDFGLCSFFIFGTDPEGVEELSSGSRSAPWVN